MDGQHGQRPPRERVDGPHIRGARAPRLGCTPRVEQHVYDVREPERRRALAASARALGHTPMTRAFSNRVLLLRVRVRVRYSRHAPAILGVPLLALDASSSNSTPGGFLFFVCSPLSLLLICALLEPSSIRHSAPRSRQSWVSNFVLFFASCFAVPRPIVMLYCF